MLLRPGADPVNLYGLDRKGLESVVEALGAKAYHAGQIFRWMYGRGRLDPSEWTDLPRTLRAELRGSAVNPGSIAGRSEASDGTVKFRVELPGGGAVEAVSMVQRERV